MSLSSIGFIRLGAMGRGMALNLVKEVEALYVCDMSQEAVKTLTDSGAIACANPAEVAQKSQVLMICVPDAPQVRSILFENSGVGEAGRDGLFVIDCTTMDRVDAIAIHDDAAEKGMSYWDCPVSGLPKRATDGSLTVMFGGTDDAFAQAKPYLDVIGDDPIHCGALGTGQAMKAVNNVIYNINIVALCEVLPLAVKAGLDPELLLELVTNGSSRSFASAHFAPRMLERNFGDDFPMQWAYKDILNVQRLAVEHKAMTPVLNAMTATYQATMANGHAMDPKSSMIKMYEKALGVEFKKAD